MDYRETLDFLYSQLPMFQRIGSAAYKNDLSNTIKLCRVLGDPQEKVPAVHIAGTNGKGSCAHLIASILQECGYKTGLFTSPHLSDFRERIRINGNKIEKEEVVRFVESYRQAVEDIKPSFFEYTAGMAFKYFEEQGVEIAVLETGMGGRLDSTNVAHTAVSVITNISMDHMRYLGDTLEKIAGEKAGIIKKGKPVIIGETQPSIQDIFIRKAEEMNSDIWFADQHYKVIPEPGIKPAVKGTEQLTILREGKQFMNDLSSPLLGDYQPKNIQTVMMAMEVLEREGFLVNPGCISKGILNVLANTGLTGRWQVLSTKPLTICDVGHNQAGIQYVVSQIEKTGYHKLHFVLGTVNDKDISEILKLLPKKAEYYFCKANIPRGLDVELLADAAHKEGLSGKPFASVKEAYRSAYRNAGNDDLVFIGGSSFVVAEILDED